MENDIFTNTHIFVKTNTQVTNRIFVFVDSKTRVQLKAYLEITFCTFAVIFETNLSPYGDVKSVI